MTLSTLRTSQGELFAFIPDLNPDVTESFAAATSVASRPDHGESSPSCGPAGEFHPCQREL